MILGIKTAFSTLIIQQYVKHWNKTLPFFIESLLSLSLSLIFPLLTCPALSELGGMLYEMES